MTWKDFIPSFITKQVNVWFKRVEEGLMTFTPPYIPKDKSLFSPIVAIVAMIMFIVLMGIAIGSFVSLFASLLVLYFILTRVFEIELNMGDVVAV